MSVIRAFFGAIGAFFGSVFGSVSLFIILIAGSIFLFAYLDSRDELEYYDARPPRHYRETYEEELLAKEAEAAALKELEAALEAAILEAGQHDEASALYGPPYPPPPLYGPPVPPGFYDDIAPQWGYVSEDLNDKEQVIRGGSDILSGNRQDTFDNTDMGLETDIAQDPDSIPQQPGSADDAQTSDSLQLDVLDNVVLNSAEIEGDDRLKERNMAADRMYQADLDAINTSLSATGSIPGSVLDSLRETLAMYEETSRYAFQNDLVNDSQAVYARIKAVQIRRFLGIPV